MTDAKGNSESWNPAYLKLKKKGDLTDRVERAYERMENCDFCPRHCRVDRRGGETGFCQAPEKAVISSSAPHFGEEVPLVGQNGSGTIFFSNCNLHCDFCQNWAIAHEGEGNEVSDEELAGLMLRLERRGCHNINLVTPTHVLPNIIHAVQIAAEEGLELPLCYNTGSYECAENIELLDGIVDIYLADLKFMDGEAAERYIGRGPEDYPQKAKAAIQMMHRQVGDLVTDEDGIALRGLMLRHLVMPNGVAGTREFISWVADNLSQDTYVNIMSQYRPAHRAFEYEQIARRLRPGEFVEAIEWAKKAGLNNLDEDCLSEYEFYRRGMV